MDFQHKKELQALAEKLFKNGKSELEIHEALESRNLKNYEINNILKSAKLTIFNALKNITQDDLLVGKNQLPEEYQNLNDEYLDDIYETIKEERIKKEKGKIRKLLLKKSSNTFIREQIDADLISDKELSELIEFEIKNNEDLNPVIIGEKLSKKQTNLYILWAWFFLKLIIIFYFNLNVIFLVLLVGTIVPIVKTSKEIRLLKDKLN